MGFAETQSLRAECRREVLRLIKQLNWHSCSVRIPRRLARPPPRSRRGNSDGSERREGERGGKAPRGAAPATPGPREGRLDAGLGAAGARLDPPGGGEARARGEAAEKWSRRPGFGHPWPGCWKIKSEALTALSREGKQPGKT